jgi:hypothetical protein
VFSLFWEVQISLYLQQEIRSSSRGVLPKGEVHRFGNL